MKTSIPYILILMSLILLWFGLSAQSSLVQQVDFGQPEHQTDEDILFELGLALMLTGNSAEADLCFREIEKQGNPAVGVLNNMGIARIMYALSLMKKDEAARIKYVFPFEVSPDLTSKGNDDKEQQRKELIDQLLTSAKEIFHQVIQRDSQYASGYLNAASSHLLLARWEDDEGAYLGALNDLDKAIELAKDQNLINTLGNAQIVEGILYDYIRKPVQRDELFELARSNSHVRVQSLANRNQNVAKGEEAVFILTSGENYDLFTDDPEQIDGVSLTQLMQEVILFNSLFLRQTKKRSCERKRAGLFVFWRGINIPHYGGPPGQRDKVREVA